VLLPSGDEVVSGAVERR